MSIPRSKFLALLLVSSMLAGCSGNNTPSKADIGTAAGAIGGGVIGYQFGGGAGKALATVGGALLGGLLGNAIGTSLDNADRAAYDSASQRAMATGQTASWKNTDSGHYGSISPQRHYMNEDGQLCREYTQTIYISGKKHTGRGTACQLPDGTWQIME